MTHNVLSIHTGHDGSFAFKDITGEYRVIEYERVCYSRYSPVHVNKNVIYKIQQFIKKHYGIESFFKVLYDCDKQPEEAELLHDYMGVQISERYSHHEAHAGGALYQSPFEEALIITCDGCGKDKEGLLEYFNVYVGRKSTGVEIVSRIPRILGIVYDLLCLPMKQIHKKGLDTYNQYNYFDFETNTTHSYSGKLMALTSFGKPRDYWLNSFYTIFKKEVSEVDWDFKENLMKELSTMLGIPLRIDSLEGPEAWDLAATLQYTLEETFIGEILPLYEKYRLPVCFSGGVALNVLLNERLRKLFSRGIYIPPNPNDCGLALGMLLIHDKPKEQVNVVYQGVPIADSDKINFYVKQYNGKKIDIDIIVKELAEGKIIGVMRGNSECGPRALGNRSILCNPAIKEMKHKLNSCIKFREEFRPFAPVVTLEKVNTYFHFDGESPYMSYAPKVRDEYFDKLKAVTHVDNTARVQTVTEKQNPFLYTLLQEFEKITGIGVLLNTSLNTKGLPMMTLIEDAIAFLKSSDIDIMIIEDFMFRKK